MTDRLVDIADKIRADSLAGYGINLADLTWLIAQVKSWRTRYIDAAAGWQQEQDEVKRLRNQLAYSEANVKGLEAENGRLLETNGDLRAESKRANESAAAMLKVITEDLPRIQAERDILRERIGYAHAALTYVGPLNEYEYLALYELGVSGDCPETMDMGRIHKLLEEEPWQ